tara:strand:+ start:293 stop:787 length:495 start_codon:yes stop_codon:yes gene_type:complete
MNFLKHNKIINNINSLIDNLLFEQRTDTHREDDIVGLQKDVADIRRRFKTSSTNPYKVIEVSFKGETKITIRALSDEFNRTLKGDMYFNIINYNRYQQYFDIRTSSFPNDLILRLYYNKLKEGVEQRGEAKLVYDRRGEFDNNRNVRESDEKDISFTIRKLVKK